MRRFLAGTPPILGLAAVDVGAELVGEAGIEAIRAKGGALTALAVDFHDAGSGRSASSSAARATPTAAVLTSRCATRTRGASAVR